MPIVGHLDALCLLPMSKYQRSKGILVVVPIVGYGGGRFWLPMSKCMRPKGIRVVVPIVGYVRGRPAHPKDNQHHATCAPYLNHHYE